MKKSKIKLLTATACLALVGTASAAWVYAGTATASANIGVKVASYASAGEITVENEDNIYVYLDNGTVKYKYVDDTKPLSATYVKPSGVDTTGKSVTRYFTVSICKTLAEYVTFTNSSYATTAEDGTVYYDLQKLVIATGASTSWTDGTDLIESLPALTWVEGKCPSGDDAKSDYATMIDTLLGNTSDTTTIDDENQNTEWDITKTNQNCLVTVSLYAAIND